MKREPFEIEVKRFYLPVDEPDCPECGEETSTFDYFSYPDANKEFLHTWYCNHCDHEWESKVIIHCYVEHLDD